MTLAVLMSGQGGQGPGMFDLTADLAAAEPVFAAAAVHLGRDPRELVRAAPDALHGNRTGQILCVTAALAGWALVAPAIPGPAVVAGYSIGDLAAWGPAGRIGTEALMGLAVRRAEEMDRAAGPGQGLAGIRGLPLDRIAALAEDHGCSLAIRNAPESGVAGGPVAGLDALCVAARAAGAVRALRLDVRVPSHTPRLTAATEALRGVFSEVETARPPAGAPRLIAGLDGAPVFSAGAGLDKLARQVSQTIDWAACLSACDEAGATRYLELGPGHALARMAETAFPGRSVRAIEAFSTPQGVRDWLARD